MKMKSVIRQIYGGDIYLNERGSACISEFRTVRDVAVQTHDAFEDKLCQPMKKELDEYLSKESDVTAYHIEQVWHYAIAVSARVQT